MNHTSNEQHNPEPRSEHDIMSVRVYIPTPFRKITGNRTFVDADGVDVNGVLRDLDQRFPGFGEMVFDAEAGDGWELLEHVNVYLNNQEIHALDGPPHDGFGRRRTGRDPRHRPAARR